MSLTLVGSRTVRLSHYFDSDEIAIGGLQEKSELSPIEAAGYKIEEIVSPILQTSHVNFLVAQAKYQKKLETAKEKDAETAKLLRNFKIKDHFPFASWKIFQWLFGMKFIDKATLKEKTQFARKLWLLDVSRAETKRLKSVKKEIQSEYSVLLDALNAHPDMKNAKEQLEKVYKALFNEDLK